MDLFKAYPQIWEDIKDRLSRHLHNEYSVNDDDMIDGSCMDDIVSEVFENVRQNNKFVPPEPLRSIYLTTHTIPEEILEQCKTDLINMLFGYIKKNSYWTYCRHYNKQKKQDNYEEYLNDIDYTISEKHCDSQDLEKTVQNLRDLELIFNTLLNSGRISLFEANIFIDKTYHGYTYEEISELNCIPVDAAIYRIKKVKKILQQTVARRDRIGEFYE